MSRYTIGVDFGTLSVRGLLVDTNNGHECASVSFEYPHAVLDRELPDGTPLKPDWALQHPQDYIDGIRFAVSGLLEQSDVCPEEIIGLGIDFTSNTAMPVDERNTPLCFNKKFASNPYAWPMLWKHHAAQKYANKMTELALERDEKFLRRCGGRISSEMMFPRLWQIAVEAPDVYAAASKFVEAGDWIIQQMTGSKACSANPASYKLFWSSEDGYPSDEFWMALDEKLVNVSSKLGNHLFPLGSCAGRLNEYGSDLTGLLQGTPVSVTCIDAHTALPAARVTHAGQMLLILGTSAAHLVLDEHEHPISGILCMARDGMIPGYYAYEAGQSCCGDHFQWFANKCCCSEYEEEAQNRGITTQQLLTEKAEKLSPGESGVLALDWWNGNRSVLMDSDLSGLLIGVTLQTRPEEIYRALVEATAFGSRKIIENFEDSGIAINEVNVCGGIAKKNVMLMQIYADILNRPLRIVRSDQANALGTAIFAAVAAGSENGGYDTIADAAAHMGGTEERIYYPNESNVSAYNRLYTEYLKLHDWFGKGGNEVMYFLKRLRNRQAE